MTGFWCRADVKGFQLPDGVRGNLTTVSGVMELIRALSSLPIGCAIPVKSDAIPIQNVSRFPRRISVETHIRQGKILKKLTQVQLQLAKTEPVNDRAYDFLTLLKHAVEDVSMSNRPLLPQFRDLANTVAEVMAQHGKRVELYKQYDELRLHTDNCDANGVTATACWLTFGLAIPFIRGHQYEVFEAAPVWRVSAHYDAKQFGNTYAMTGYYDRIKVQLCFSDDTLLDTWRQHIDTLLQQKQSRRRELVQAVVAVFGGA